MPMVWRTHRFATKADEPIKFSSSKAKIWRAEFSRKGIPNEDESAWFQPIVVTSSVAIFLVYFCILREENDIDEQIGKSLYERIDGLEEVHLRTLLEYNLNQGKDTTEITSRLKEIQEEKKALLH